MNKKAILKELGRIGALVQNSHIVYTSGRHGSEYVNKDAIYPHIDLTAALCRELAAPFFDQNVEAVLAPALGGIILSQWTAHHIQAATAQPVLALYAEKSGEGFLLTRGYDKLIAGKRTLVVEDVVTTGGSIKAVVRLATASGAKLVGAAVLCNRGGIQAKAVGDVPKLHSLLELSLDSWAPDQCPLCAKDIPINTDFGKGREFLAKRIRPADLVANGGKP